MERGDPALWWTLDPKRKSLVVGYLAAAGMDRLEAAKSRKSRKSGHQTPGWMQQGSALFMPDLD